MAYDSSPLLRDEGDDILAPASELVHDPRFQGPLEGYLVHAADRIDIVGLFLSDQYHDLCLSV